MTSHPLLDQVLTIMGQDENCHINFVDDTGVYYQFRESSGFLEPQEYQDFINFHATLSPCPELEGNPTGE